MDSVRYFKILNMKVRFLFQEVQRGYVEELIFETLNISAFAMESYYRNQNHFDTETIKIFNDEDYVFTFIKSKSCDFIRKLLYKKALKFFVTSA